MTGNPVLVRRYLEASPWGAAGIDVGANHKGETKMLSVMRMSWRELGLAAAFGGLALLYLIVATSYNVTPPSPPPLNLTEPSHEAASKLVWLKYRDRCSLVRYVGSDSTGTGYMAGCGGWIYYVTFYRDGREVDVARITGWNGIN